MDIFKLDGKVALITGASSGIGRGCAEVFAQAGAKVFIIARRSERLEEARTGIVSKGGICEFFACDISTEEGCKAAVEACIRAFGRLDILVNSAGVEGEVTFFSPVDEQFSTENYKKVMSVNLDAVFYMTKYAYFEMEKVGGGSIINISSAAAIKAIGSVVYATSKGAIKSMNQTLGYFAGPRKIRVNTIYPGFIATELTAAYIGNPEFLEGFLPTIPLRDYGRPEDIAYCALYLASDAAKYVTGQDFRIDGGMTC